MPTSTIDRHVSIVLGDGTVVDNSNPLPTSGGAGGGGTQYADGTAVNPSTGNAILWNDGGTVRVPSAAKPLPVNVVAGSGSGLSVQDEATWTAGASNFVPGGGVFNDSAAALTSGQQGSQRVTPNRAGHVNLRAQAGAELGTAGSPLGVELSDGAAFYTAAKDATLSTTNTEIGGLTETAPASDTASSGLNGRLQRVAQRLTSLIALFPSALVGGRLDVNVGATVTPANVALDATVGTTNTEIGGLTETAPASDTASSGLNGRLQRVAQRLTSLIALLPSALVGGRLDVNVGKIPGTVSTSNSSTTPLTAAAAFTGLSEDVSGYATIVVNVLADQASAAGGLALQFSSDGTHWDLATSYSVTANVAFSLSVPPQAEFFRIVYTNGATNQGSFRLQVVYHQAGVAAMGITPFLAGLTPSAGGAGMLAAGSVIYNATADTLAVQRSLNSLSDGAAGGATVGAGALVFNGSTWDKGRTAASATGTTGTGLLGAGVLRLSVAHGSAPTTVTAGQYVPALASRAGVAFVAPGHPNNITQTVNYTAAQTNTVLIANSAGTKIIVTSFMVTASAANSVNVAAAIGLAQTVTPPSGTTNRFGSHPNIAPGSGFGRGNGGGIIAVGADGDQVLITSTVPTGGAIDVCVEYHTTPT